jgi:hypothetical protein
MKSYLLYISRLDLHFPPKHLNSRSVRIPPILGLQYFQSSLGNCLLIYWVYHGGRILCKSRFLDNMGKASLILIGFDRVLGRRWILCSNYNTFSYTLVILVSKQIAKYSIIAFVWELFSSQFSSYLRIISRTNYSYPDKYENPFRNFYNYTHLNNIY